MLRTQHEVRTTDGRLLLVEVAGPERGVPVFFHHGTPGSRYRDGEMTQAGVARGLCSVSYSRPGYEGSDRLAGRRIVDCVEDVRAIVAQLGLERGFVVGESGGGPHALAHAALLPEWVRGVTVVVGTAPFEAEGLDWFEGMARGNREEFDAVMAGEDEGLALLEAKLEEVRAAENPQQLSEAQGDLLTDADRRSLQRKELEDDLMLIWRRIAAGGPWGWFDDGRALLGGWGFDLDKVEAPVSVWHGEDDRTVSVAHGRWVADHLPKATLHLLPGEGHSSLMDHYGEILDDLLASGS